MLQCPLDNKMGENKEKAGKEYKLRIRVDEWGEYRQYDAHCAR